MPNLNDVKLEGTIVSKVNKTDLESGIKLANFILKTDGDHPVYIMVKFSGKKPIELEKNQHIWIKGSLANMKRKDGSYEIGVSASAYKVHDQANDESEPSGFKGVLPKRRH